MQLQNLATSDYYAPVKISSRFIPCRPCLPARAFLSKKYPSGEGYHTRGWPWCMVPGASRWVQYQHLNPHRKDKGRWQNTSCWLPLRTGGFTMPVSFNKFAANRTTFRFLSCEEFNTSHLCAFSTGWSQHHNTSQATEAKCPTTEKTCNYDYCLLQRCRITV